VRLLSGAREALATLRLLGGLRSDAARRGRISSTAGPGAPPRPAARRPGDDPALTSALDRWRERATHGAPSPPVSLTARETAEAMRHLEDLRQRMSPDRAAAIAEHAGAGRVTVRRLRPEDGYVWEMPGVRVFAIVGVQAFTVEDED
jgi:hypothetical protein